MKKLIALFLVLLLFCSCGAQEEPVADEQEEPVSESSESEEEIPGEPEISEPSAEPENENPEEIIIEADSEISYIGENGKLGFCSGGVPVTEAIFDRIVQINDIEDDEVHIHCTYEESKKVYAGIIADGTRKTIGTNASGWAQTEERENVLYYLFEKGSDSLINEVPLVNFYYTGIDGYGNSLNRILVSGTNDGDLYEYIREESGWGLYQMQSGGVYYAYNEDYSFTQYYWKSGEKRYGLETPDGKIIIEPIYASQPKKINDRFIVYDGYPSIHPDDIVRTFIMDIKGNIICDEYDYITVFSWNGRFILIASKNDGGDYHEWLIDLDGNKLSESYNRIEPVEAEDNRGRFYYVGLEVWEDKPSFNFGDATEIIPIEEYMQYYK